MRLFADFEVDVVEDLRVAASRPPFGVAGQAEARQDEEERQVASCGVTRAARVCEGDATRVQSGDGEVVEPGAGCSEQLDGRREERDKFIVPWRCGVARLDGEFDEAVDLAVAVSLDGQFPASDKLP